MHGGVKMIYLMFCLGLALLVGGGEVLVNSGIKLANRLRLPPLVVGIVLMGFGTSLPELSASLSALSANPPVPGIAFGNIIGSNISNILFILGLSAAISPVIIDKSGFRRDGLFLIISVLMLGLVMWFGRLDSVIGVFFILFILGYFVVCYDKSPAPQTQHLTHKKELPIFWLLFLSVLGIVAIVYGANLLVESATGIALSWGVKESVLGLTLVAFGTSLPELTVSFVAAMHKQSAVAYGNIIGSNIANVFAIVGAMGLYKSVLVPQLWTSFWIMVATTLAMIICGLYQKIPRWAGFLFLIAYGGYIYYLFQL